MDSPELHGSALDSVNRSECPVALIRSGAKLIKSNLNNWLRGFADTLPLHREPLEFHYRQDGIIEISSATGTIHILERREDQAWYSHSSLEFVDSTLLWVNNMPVSNPWKLCRTEKRWSKEFAKRSYLSVEGGVRLSVYEYKASPYVVVHVTFKQQKGIARSGSDMSSPVRKSALANCLSRNRVKHSSLPPARAGSWVSAGAPSSGTRRLSITREDEVGQTLEDHSRPWVRASVNERAGKQRVRSVTLGHAPYDRPASMPPPYSPKRVPSPLHSPYTPRDTCYSHSPREKLFLWEHASPTPQAHAPHITISERRISPPRQRAHTMSPYLGRPIVDTSFYTDTRSFGSDFSDFGSVQYGSSGAEQYVSRRGSSEMMAVDRMDLSPSSLRNEYAVPLPDFGTVTFDESGETTHATASDLFDDTFSDCTYTANLTETLTGDVSMSLLEDAGVDISDILECYADEGCG